MAVIVYAPVVVTNAATSVAATSVTLNGNLTDTGFWNNSGSSAARTITARGFYYTTDPTFVTSTKVTASGTSTGTYSVNVTGLTANTTYYFKAYAESSAVGDGQENGLGGVLNFIYLLPTDNVQKSYIYKIFNNGEYLGNLPNVISEYKHSQDINTAGSQITISCGVSADTSLLSVETLLSEDGTAITDESDVPLTTEGLIPIVTPGNSGINTLVKNGNRVEVWEYGYYHLNGQKMFSGPIERWEASFGDDANQIDITAYSDGQDLDNYLIRGYPYTYTLDQSQATQDGYASTHVDIMGSWHKDGQTWTASASNLGAISLMLNGTATVTVKIYSGAFGTFLGQSTKSVSVGTNTELQFQFATIIPTTAGNTYSVEVLTAAGQTIKVYKKSTNAYASGSYYTSDYGGGSGGGGWGQDLTQDLYFKTYSGVGSTTCTFTSLEPVTGMLRSFMDDYIGRGGLITYTTASTQSTGLSLTYAFNTNTTLEGVRAMLTLAPSNFYYYVDLGTNTLYFKASNTTPDLVLVKDKHLNNLKIVATIETVKNSVYFTGGATAGVNLYKQYNDATSLSTYGLRLDRLTDNRVTVSGTADAIGGSDLAEKKDEQYQTIVTIMDKTMDITLLKPGMVIGFAGFGTFVDYILAQVVRVDYSPEQVTLTLGILPKRMNPEFDKVTRGLVALQTILNPSAPS